MSGGVLLRFQPPEDIFPSVNEWLELGAESKRKGIYKPIYPHFYLKKRAKNPPVRYPIKLAEGYAAIIPGGRVWGDNGAIVTPENKLIWDVSLEWVKNKWDHSIFKMETLPPVTDYYDAIADLTHVGSRNYYHWMFEVLPRLHLIRESGFTVNRYIMKYAPEHSPFQSETMTHLGISRDDIKKTHRHFHIQAENLVVPSQPSFVTKWAYDFLRNSFLTENKLNPSINKRIYISRRVTRRILNENDLIEFLIGYGFIKVELEWMSVAEQVQLFSGAEAIVAPHGAGLTNLTFCPPKTKILEIFPSTYITGLYWLISALGNLDYYYFIGASEQVPNAQQWHGYDNLTIDMKKFSSFFKTIGIK